MIKTFTQDDVIRYIYCETSTLETIEIEKALLCDDKLQDLYKEIKGVVSQLDNNMHVPSPGTISNILSYAKKRK